MPSIKQILPTERKQIRRGDSRIASTTKGQSFLSAFLTEKWQSQNFGRELVFSADLCYNGANEKPSSGRKVARVE